MRLRRDSLGLDDIDRRILGVLQSDCKTPLAKMGEMVGLSAPSIVERVRRLENEGFVRGYHARLDPVKLGMGVTAFVGVSLTQSRAPEPFDELLEEFQGRLGELGGVMECHHVTGEYTLLIKVKTWSTASLQSLIGRLRSLPTVERTETNVVLSTLAERVDVSVGVGAKARSAESGAEPAKDSA